MPRGAAFRPVRFRRWLAVWLLLMAGPVSSASVSGAEPGPVAATAPAATTLVGHWAFDEGSGPVARDSTAFANDGVLVGATWAAGGVSGSALAFDGVAAHVRVPNAVQYDGAGGITVAAWIRMASDPTSAQADVLDKSHRSIDAPPHYSGYALQASSALPNTMNVVACNGTTCAEVGSGVALADDRWHLIVGTVSSASARMCFYLDGALTQEAPFAGSLLANGGDLFIGRHGLLEDRSFRGWIDDVRLYDGALTAADVAALFERVQPVRLIGHWAFDEGAGSTAGDSSVHRNAGVVHGATWVAEGISGAALAFDGVDSWVHIPDAPQYQITDAISVEAWVRMAPDQTQEQPSVLDKSHRSGGPPPDFSGFTIQGALGGSYAMDLVVGDGHSFGEVGSVTPLNDGAWHFIAGTASSATGSLRFYVDGELTQELPFGGPLAPNPDDLFIGRFWGAQGRYFHGLIDEVRLYHGALSATQIRAHYDARVVSAPGDDAARTGASVATAMPNPARGPVRLGAAAIGALASGCPIRILDPSGRLIRILAARRTVAGTVEAWWDGCDGGGRLVPPGTYLARFGAGAVMARIVIVR